VKQQRKSLSGLPEHVGIVRRGILSSASQHNKDKIPHDSVRNDKFLFVRSGERDVIYALLAMLSFKL